MKYYLYIRIFLIAIPVIILGFLVYKDFNPSNNLTIAYNFCDSTPFISEFSPHGRVLDINQQDCTQTMVIDPVYFDVRLPHNFDKMYLKVWYTKDIQVPLKIGPAINLSNWKWQLKDIIYSKKINNISLGQAEYDLSRIRLDKNRLRFLISSPGLDKFGESIVFYKIELQFTRSSELNSSFIKNLKDWLKFTNIYFLLKG